MKTAKNRIDIDRLIALGIPNLRAITKDGAVIGVRGETLSGARNRKHMRAVKESGINSIIDFRSADHTGKLMSMCESAGLDYFHFPVDQAATPDEEIIRNFPRLKKLMNRGGFYMACAMGMHCTDIALALCWLFDPKAQEVPILYGQHRDGVFRCDDIYRRANSVYRSLTAEDKAAWSWSEDFDKGFDARKKMLTQVQNDYIAEASKEEQARLSAAADTAPIDIGSSKREGPAARLSNFTERHFIFDGAMCASIEGVLQSFKFSEPERQREICAMVGVKAKNAGRQTDWRPGQTLYWNGTAYPRHGAEYQHLLDRLYAAVYEQDVRFTVDLFATGERKLTHSIGNSDPKETILTEREFCDRLEKLRANIRRL